MAKKQDIQSSMFDEVVSQKMVVEPQRKEKVYDTPTDIGLNGDDKEFGTYISNINKLPPLQQLSDKEVIIFLYKHYWHVLERITQPDMANDKIRLNDYLVLQRVSDGICQCARLKLGVRIKSNTEWLVRFMGRSKLYWAPPPHLLSKCEDMIESIRKRYENLKILNDEYISA